MLDCYSGKNRRMLSVQTRMVWVFLWAREGSVEWSLMERRKKNDESRIVFGSNGHESVVTTRKIQDLKFAVCAAFFVLCAVWALCVKTGDSIFYHSSYLLFEACYICDINRTNKQTQRLIPTEKPSMSLRGRYIIDRIKRFVSPHLKMPVPPYGKSWLDCFFYADCSFTLLYAEWRVWATINWPIPFVVVPVVGDRILVDHSHGLLLLRHSAFRFCHVLG